MADDKTGLSKSAPELEGDKLPVVVAKPEPAPPKAVPAQSPSGPSSESSGSVSPRSGAPRKKVNKLTGQWAAKDAADGAAEAGQSSSAPVRPSGPKKIVVKAKRGPSVAGGLSAASSLTQEGSDSGPGSATMRATPTAPPPDLSDASKAATMRAAPKESPEELVKMNERRTNICREIFETEKTYVRNLKEICDLYIGPMKESKWKDYVPRIFSNVQSILSINEELLGGLSDLIAKWSPTKSLVGPIFQKMAPFMRLYNTYGNSYNEAIALLSKLKEKDDFVQFLASCRGSQPLDLEALLIQPVQRIPRYRLLLEDLMKNTPVSHPDFENTENSLKHIRDVATNVNESIRATEQSKKMAEQTGLQKYIAPHRKLLLEGFFSAKVSVLGGDAIKGSIDVALYLFNDLLVFFFAKPVKLKDPRKLDFTELAWPSALMWPALDGKLAFRVVGPGYSLLLSSRDKDTTVASSQVAGFHQRLMEVCNSDVTAVPGSLPKPANPTPGTHFGAYETPEGISYAGEWKDGLMHGRGVLNFPGGLRVEGTFDEGLKHGECKIVFPTGETYTGSCMKDDQHGVGRIVWPNGDCYNGYWLGGRRDGDGTFTCAHYKYVGSWSDGFMEGEGKLTFNGGGCYEGKFKEGKFHGEGRLTRSNGIRTRGTWVTGVQEGEGEEVYPESMPFKSYQGMFKNDKREGSGTMFYRDGSQYKGEWKNGYRNGRGILTCPSRPIMRYEGMWLDDKFEGKGEIFFSTKDRYIGAFSSGCMHGIGTYIYSNGTQMQGEWKNGIRQRKLVMSGGPSDQRWEMELTCSKERVELGDAKVNNRMMSYFVPPTRPDLDQCLLEVEVVPDIESNLLTGVTNARASSSSSSQPTLEVPTVDSPSAVRVDKQRSGSFFRKKE